MKNNYKNFPYVWYKYCSVSGYNAAADDQWFPFTKGQWAGSFCMPWRDQVAWFISYVDTTSGVNEPLEIWVFMTWLGYSTQLIKHIIEHFWGTGI